MSNVLKPVNWVGSSRKDLKCRNLDPSCQTLSDFDGFDMAGGKSGLGSQSRPNRYLTFTAAISQEPTLGMDLYRRPTITTNA